MKDLIQIKTIDDRQVVDSRLIAQELGIKHPNFYQSVKKYRTVIESDFGKVMFETRPSTNSHQTEKMAFLTENQAIFLATLSRNSEKVILFKSKLVRSFMAARKALQTVPANQDDLILMLAQRNVDNARRLSAVEQGLKKLEAKTNASDAGYFSVVGYASLHGHKVDLKLAGAIGRKCSRMCRDLGYVMGSIPDPRFGKVKTYPSEVLKIVFSETLLLTPQTI